MPQDENLSNLLPNERQALIHRRRAGRLLEELRIKDAVTELEQAISHNPRDGKSWQMLAEIYGAAGFYEPAASYAQKCLAEDYMNTEAWVLLANIYCQLGGPYVDLAYEQLHNVPDQENADVQYLLGNIYAQKGEKELAEQHLKKALELNPNHRYARHDLKAVQGN